MQQLTNKDLSNAIRFLTVDAVENAKSGHPGMPLGMADVCTILFKNHLKFYALKSKWRNRDRFVLSGGHGSMLLYSLLYLCGYPDISLDDIKNFRKLYSKCAGHPEYLAIEGIETTTGPLGQGIANAVGMAISEAHLNAKDPKIDHYTYVLATDGDLMEGISHEAFSLAGHLKLKKLIILFDDNNVTIDGPLSLSCSDDTKKRFEAYNFEVQKVDGHNYDEIDLAISNAKKSEKPSLIMCKSIIGHHASKKAGLAIAHGAPLGEEVILEMREKLNWPYKEFEIPKNILNKWREIGVKHKDLYDHDLDKKENYNFDIKDIKDLKADVATRVSSQKVINHIVQKFDNLILGSADLTPSNNTKADNAQVLSHNNYSGQYIHYGIREHAMASIMNGISLHDNLRPAAGTFLCFSDYMKPAIRLSAMMKQGVIYIFTHDSIGLGEDGPTHQPIEHLANLRGIPNLLVLRPMDAIETAQCWEIALKNTAAPSALCLSRQNLPLLRTDDYENKSKNGGYILKQFGDPTINFISTGSEVHIALEVAQKLFKEKNIGSSVISVPCLELFKDLSILGNKKRVIIEAGIKQSWDFLLRKDDMFFGVDSYGESAPFKDVYKHFGLTISNIYKKILS